jgi:LAS superfamily LD-carboxypeptidase LdcB
MKSFLNQLAAVMTCWGLCCGPAQAATNSTQCPAELLPAGLPVTLKKPPTAQDLGPLASFDEATRDLLRRTYVAQATWAASIGRAFVAERLADESLALVANRVCLRRDAADAAIRMLAAARADLKEAQGRGAVPSGVTFSAASGYRSPQYQAKLWVNNVSREYMKRVALREVNGRFDDASVTRLAKHTRGNLAAPGFSNHHKGIAVDFIGFEPALGNLTIRSTANNIRAWQRSWFHGWLKRNADKHGFKPYSPEPWHWEFVGAPRLRS